MITDDPAHVAQRTFRALLSALAHPGRVTPIAEPVDAPAELGRALAAGALALLDRDVLVWLSPAAPAGIGAWLVAETGCRLTADPGSAEFALVLDPADALPLERWNAGTVEVPERSATLLVRVEALAGGRAAVLAGPGVEHTVTVAPLGMPAAVWPAWSANAARFPCGVDVFFFDADCVTGVPRTVAERPA